MDREHIKSDHIRAARRCASPELLPRLARLQSCALTNATRVESCLRGRGGGRVAQEL